MLAQEHATALLMCPAVLCHAVSCCAGVVLAAASPYFETLLRGWACSHQPLHMVVGEEQLAAAQQVETGFSKSLLALFSVCGICILCVGVWVYGASSTPATCHCLLKCCHMSVPLAPLSVDDLVVLQIQALWVVMRPSCCYRCCCCLPVLQLMSFIYTGSLQPRLPQPDLLPLLLLANH